MALALLVLLMGGCSKTPRYAQSMAMDTLITITVYRPEDERAANEGLSLVDAYDAQWSAYRADSDIYRLNQSGQACLSGDTADLVRTAMQYATISDGAYDPTIFPITSLWHITKRTADEPLPDEQAVDEAKSRVDYTLVVADERPDGGLSVTLQPGMGLDMGGIAKGFAADKLKEYLQSKGIEDAIISLGGNVCLMGDETYTVGLEDPRADGIFAKLRISDINVVTSGDYQRYIEIDGQRIHHIFDPHTGYSVDNNLCSVTIIGHNGAQCDALSTAVYVLGLEDGMDFAKSQGVDAILVTKDGKIYMTDGIRDVFTLVNTAYTIQ